MLIVLLSSLSFADDGIVYPDSADISFVWSVDNDTITLMVQNNSGQAVTDFYLSTNAPVATTLIDCIVDASVTVPDNTDLTLGAVYTGMYNTRYIIDSFSDKVILKYYPFSADFSFSAGKGFPVFGVPRKVGPPAKLQWNQ